MDTTELIRLAVEQTRDYALFVLDPQGNIVTWNNGAEAIKGYTRDEILGRHFSVFYLRESVESGWPAHELKVATAEGRFEDEGWRVRKDGSRFWANVVITAIRDRSGRLVGFSKVTRDLTERKRQEEVLRQSEERFRLLVEGVHDYAIFMLDPRGTVTSWNAGAQRIIGYDADQIIGRHFSRFFTDADIREGKPWEELAIARDTGRFEGEGWRIRANLDRFWARAVVTALTDADGRLRGYAKVTQDLTDRKHIQSLEAAARNVNEFIAILAHELRNPLAPIQSALHVLDSAPRDPVRRERMTDIIRRQTGQLRRIVDDMLDIARVTRGELALDRYSVDLSEIVRNATQATALEASCRNHRLELDLASQPLIVDGDPQRLSQVVMNLLDNACKYTDPGGHVMVRTAVDDGLAVLSIRDTGRGVDPEALGDIFEMFVRRSPVIERPGAGLGIGLALSRRIAEMHGGSLTAASEGVGRGSVFTFRMPLQQRPAVMAPDAALDIPGPSRTNVERILIVDDNRDAAATLDLLLTSLGYRTQIAATGIEALQCVAGFRPEVVLLDIGLPGIDGYEVARRLRAMPNLPPMKIIAVTGWGSESDKDRSREAGIDVHLVKPIDHNDLRMALGPPATMH